MTITYHPGNVGFHINNCVFHDNTPVQTGRAKKDLQGLRDKGATTKFGVEVVRRVATLQFVRTCLVGVF